MNKVQGQDRDPEVGWLTTFSLARDSSEVEEVEDGELLLRNVLRGSNGHAGRIVRVLALQNRDTSALGGQQPTDLQDANGLTLGIEDVVLLNAAERLPACVVEGVGLHAAKRLPVGIVPESRIRRQEIKKRVVNHVHIPVLHDAERLACHIKQIAAFNAADGLSAGVVEELQERQMTVLEAGVLRHAPFVALQQPVPPARPRQPRQ